MTESILSKINAGNEGWVYIIHAVGTTRYKIGRSINPIARLEVLKGQSPYPLKVIWTGWTIDAIEDEKRMHQSLVKYRVHGEWFELEEQIAGKEFAKENPINRATIVFDYHGVMAELRDEIYDICLQTLLTFCKKEDNAQKSKKSSESAGEAHYLCFSVQSIQQTYAVYDFFHKQIPALVEERCSASMPYDLTFNGLDNFIAGLIRYFALTALGQVVSGREP